jgi:hypothetical protein
LGGLFSLPARAPRRAGGWEISSQISHCSTASSTFEGKLYAVVAALCVQQKQMNQAGRNKKNLYTHLFDFTESFLQFEPGVENFSSSVSKLCV